MLDVVCVCVCMLESEVTRWGGKTPELRATSSNQSGVLSFLKETSVHPKIVLSTSVEAEVARMLRQKPFQIWGFQLERILPMKLTLS